jgi:hypothetical protein
MTFRLNPLTEAQLATKVEAEEAAIQAAPRGLKATMTFTIKLAHLKPLLADGVTLEQIATAFREEIRTAATKAADDVLGTGLDGRPIASPPQFTELHPEGGIYSENILFDLS